MTAKTSPIDEYLATVPPEQRAALEDLRAVMRSVVPEAEEVISYNLPALSYEGRVVGGFAAAKNHLAYYPFSGSTAAEFADELKDYPGTKGSIHFTTEHPLPPDLVRRMIESRIVANRKK